jgi:hypothetical protein
MREWKPGWIVAPAEILAEWLDEHGLSPAVVAVACAPKGPVRDHCLARIQAVLAKEPMTAEDAAVVAKATQTSGRLWEGLEHNYRAGLAAGLTGTGVAEGAQ